MTHRNPTSRQLRGRGITLIEMMVALAITTFVVLVVNQLFNGVIQTVGRGTQAGEILQRSRAFDEQIATETELIISGGRDPKNNPHDWFGRMVGPKGRDTGHPGGFLVVVQRVIPTPLTLDDQVKGIVNRPVRSDQLMFIYDQTPRFDQTGKKRLPPLAPANNNSFGGDMWNSLNAEYVRIWYGHAVQLPADPSTFDLANHDLGIQIAGNPNAVAQDWVLGRHALFLTDSSAMLGGQPVGAFISKTLPAFSTGNVVDGPSGTSMFHGITDIADNTLNDIVNGPMGLNALPSALGYQGRVLSMMFTTQPLHTSAKPITPTSGELRVWDVAPTHTYFMGGVSDFIVEFAGDLVNDTFYLIDDPTQIGPDGELDRDPEGRIKWYTAVGANFKTALNSPPAISRDQPITYPTPRDTDYRPRASSTTVNAFSRADAAFVWQHDGSPGFTQWPWMLRIRYRLHDRRGQFEGREVTVNTATGETQPEAGAWFETIIPVNYQGVK